MARRLRAVPLRLRWRDRLEADVPLTAVRVLMARAFERRVRWVILAAVGAAASVAEGQSLDAGRAGIAGMRSPSLAPRRLVSPIASAAIPGLGQALLGQSRSLAYLAIEAVAWWRYSTDMRSRDAEQAEFKQLASRVARAPFPLSTRDSDWTYYEMMRDYKESGLYS